MPPLPPPPLPPREKPLSVSWSCLTRIRSLPVTGAGKCLINTHIRRSLGLPRRVRIPRKRGDSCRGTEERWKKMSSVNPLILFPFKDPVMSV